ncbi:MAG: class I SAM-dependent methyltransferase [Nitratireductor sp.]|nr:class I SAM-dependent methyltransferase [Nitratireductor sp.]
MSHPKTGELWDAGFRAGKYDFLHKESEKERLKVIAGLVAGFAATHGICEVVDIGCGEGLLLPLLDQRLVSRYLGVDISTVALERLPASAIEVLRICKSLGEWDGKPEPMVPRVIVASEILYYDPDGVGELVRLATSSAVPQRILVSCVAAHPGKPNWAEASTRLWQELGEAPLNEIGRHSVQDGETGLSWDIGAYSL